MYHIERASSLLLVLLAFSAVGAFLGWLVGASETPVVAALIPLVFGLTGVLWQRYSTLRERVDSALVVERAQGAERAMDVVRGGSGANGSRPSREASVISLAIIVFIVTAFVGVQRGIDMRVPRIPPLRQLVAGDSTLAYREAATLAKLRLDLASMRLDSGEVLEVFRSAVVPLLRNPEYAPGGALHNARLDALREVTRQLTAASAATPRRGRNPAADTPASDLTTSP